jgi:hypothetical protein
MYIELSRPKAWSIEKSPEAGLKSPWKMLRLANPCGAPRPKWPWSKILDLSRSLAWQEWLDGGAWAWRSSSNVLDQMFENKTV